VPQDYSEAARWYKLAAEQGHREAEFNLGLMYAAGDGVTRDDREAARWYRLAAEQGLAEAQFNLAAFYALGTGVPRDYVVAYQWLCLAAAAGDSNAVTGKERVAARLSPEQIARAQAWAAAWKPCTSNEDCKLRLGP